LRSSGTYLLTPQNKVQNERRCQTTEGKGQGGRGQGQNKRAKTRARARARARAKPQTNILPLQIILL